VGLSLLKRDSSARSSRDADSRRSARKAAALETVTGGTEILGAPEAAQINLDSSGSKSPRLVADRDYFGIEAEALRAGAERTLARLSRLSPEEHRIDVRTLSEDFRTDQAGAAVLLSAFLAGGLLHPNGAGAYLPTRHFRQCALARVVAPMTRDRAKSVLDRACKLAEQINKEWTRNPYRIKTIVVSGGYMTRRKQLSELSLSLGLSKRQQARAGGSTTAQARDEAGRQIVQAMSNLSSFINVRIVSERHAVPRPFSVVFQADHFVNETSAPAWGRFLDWSSALTRRLASR
jgi:hypothetical protein